MEVQLPSAKALVPFVSVENMMRLIHHIGIETILRELADRIEADFRRWDSFDKTPRLASHSRAGVIELMPTSDGLAYSFKYVNGHPINALGGLQTVAAFGLQLVVVSLGATMPSIGARMVSIRALTIASTLVVASIARKRRPAECNHKPDPKRDLEETPHSHDIEEALRR